MEEYFDPDTNETVMVNASLAQASTTELRRNPLYSQVEYFFHLRNIDNTNRTY
jgi:hypothetical protein